VQEFQHQTVAASEYHLDLSIRYRNLANKKTGWIEVSSEIIGDEFLVHDQNIALLRPVTGKDYIIIMID
jgi:hypothetical protein